MLPQLDEILDLARVEARRWRHRKPDLVHVAYVMANLFPAEFDERFGRAGRELLEELLRADIDGGTLHRARTILAEAESVGEAMELLHAHLMLPDVMSDDIDLAAIERWLVLQIEDRFRLYARKPTNDTLDEIYVLVAGLKILGFQDSHLATKERLLAIRTTP